MQRLVLTERKEARAQDVIDLSLDSGDKTFCKVGMGTYLESVVLVAAQGNNGNVACQW